MSADEPPVDIRPSISRVAVAWACVATNDAHPLHIDHEYAQASGYRDAVVPGSIIAGWIGEYLTEWAGGIENLVDWKLRLLAPVWPGQTVRIAGQVEDRQDRSFTGNLEAVDETGKVVAKAWAEMRIDAARKMGEHHDAK